MEFLIDAEPEDVRLDQTIWAEKYRPYKLDEYVGNETLKAKVRQYIETNDIPHLLFHGSAGTGKTSLAKLIVRNIKCDSLYINASDENGIETIRVKIKNFACNVGFKPIKVIILDEADYITPAGQAALRNTMETFSQHTRFILTCNYHERIISPIVSRCQVFSVVPPSKSEAAMKLLNILTAENVEFEKKDIALLVQSYYPDLRAVIGTAQCNVINGELKLKKEDVLLGDIKTELVELIKSNNRGDALKAIRQLMADNGVRSYNEFYSYLSEKVYDYAPNHAAQLYIVINKFQVDDVIAPDKELCFVACVSELLTVIK